MDSELYNNLIIYLTTQQLPNNLNIQQQRQFINKSKQFQIQNQLLYKIDKRQNNNLLRVIKHHEVEAVLYMTHNDPTAGHFAVDIMFEKIRSRYYWPQFYEDIRKYVQACDQCQRRGKPSRNEPLHPIFISEPFYQIGIDIVGPLPRTKNNNRYIITAIDYLTRWPEAKAVPEATAKQVATFIYECIICQHGCPSRILSDRGTHFNNQVIAELLEKFKIRHLFSTPYHPQTNGLVERFNRTICESLAKLADQHNEWDMFIAPTLFAYRTSKNATTKMEPFFLVYGRSAKLPIDHYLPVSQQDQHETLDQRVQHLIDNLPNDRMDVQAKIKDSQSKQKVRFDENLKKVITFNIGDKVLYFNAAKAKQWSGKLDPKWKGPYYIHQVLINGSYKLRTLDGNVLSTPVNGNLLKPYYEKHWEPIIYI
jgi:hypothetical protein